MTDWFDNDALFRRELEAGHRWASMVTARLNEEGIPAELTPLTWREDIKDRHDFAAETDITIPTSTGMIQIESKSRNLHFTDDPHSYPYNTAFVDTVSGWDKKPEKPYAVVLTSQKTTQMLVIPSRQSPRGSWTIKDGYDRVRNISDQWYEVPRSTLRSFQALVESLRERL